MSPQEEQARVALILKSASQYPTTKLEPAHIAAYVEATADLPLAVLAEACVKAGRRSPNFFPPVPLILRCAKRLVAVEAGIKSPDDAWDWVLQHIGSSGRNLESDPNRDGLAERAVAVMGGFEELGQKNVSERNWTRREFMAIYKSLHSQASEDAFADPTKLLKRGTSEGLTRIGQ